jgi:catechol 2,3-dioxygenase-like lactoylglutathione lyase family enzyme
MTAIIEGMEAVTVHIRDVHKTRAFYGEVLGLKEITFSESAQRVVYAIPGTTVTLRMHVQGEDEGGREPGTISGVVFSHHDPVAACAEIRRRGGTIVDEPETITPPGMKTTLAVFADPDGNQFVLRSPPVPNP